MGRQDLRGVQVRQAPQVRLDPAAAYTLRLPRDRVAPRDPVVPAATVPVGTAVPAVLQVPRGPMAQVAPTVPAGRADPADPVVVLMALMGQPARWGATTTPLRRRHMLSQCIRSLRSTCQRLQS